MANLLFSILSTFNDKGLKKASKQLSLFEKQTKSLQGTFLKTFSALALLNYSKKAVMAFAADEAAAKSLAVQLKNTGNAFQIGEVENYIANLQNLYKVLDDQLRPAFQTLLNATGSVTLSQSALETALNVSAGTGENLETVIGAISAGVRGQTKAIKGLNTGIDSNIIASGDMNKIMAALEQRFTGAALAKLDTYAGKMDTLKVAAAGAAEIIGKGLLDALTKLSGDTTLSNFSDYVDHLATNIAKLVSGLGRFGSTLIPGNMVKVNGEYRLKSELKGTQLNARGERDSVLMGKTTKARKDEYAIITASNKAKTDIDKLKDKFDIERIGLMAALNFATDEETKLRIKAQLAILDNNDALAKKYNAELDAANGAKKLSEELTATADALAKLRLVTQADYTKQMYSGSSIYYNTYNSASVPMGSASGGGPTYVDNSVNVNNAGDVITSDTLLTTVQEALQRLNKQGSPTYAAGSL
jgi:hypothetical protein